MSDLYKLGQSQQGEIQNVGEEIRLDVQLSEDPFLSTGSVTGTITDPNGNTVQGALVKIMDNNHNPLYHALTDVNGKYNISAIAPGSEYHFHVVKDGYLISEETSFSIVAGQTLEINSIIIPDPNAALSTIAGHVTDPDGNPVENLVATLVKIEQGEENPVAVTTTNEYGQYVFVNIQTGDYIIRITGLGYKAAEVQVTITQPGSIVKVETVIQISPVDSQGTINGIISDENGNPIVGAAVILYEVTGDPDNPTLTPIRYTRTIEGGVYLFGEVPQGKYVVKSTKERTA
ncbi:MAG: hypothetical protein PWP31_804 [Clostridia bacterium]|nr:hypothetical protein [Clostridia bacterium]